MNLRQAAQQALEALQYPLETSSQAFDADKAELLSHRAIDALRAALAEPQTTHWEGCEEVHPECKKPEQAAIRSRT